MTLAWNKTGWRNKERIQMPDYIDTDALNAVESRLSSYPPKVKTTAICKIIIISSIGLCR